MYFMLSYPLVLRPWGVGLTSGWLVMFSQVGFMARCIVNLSGWLK